MQKLLLVPLFLSLILTVGCNNSCKVTGKVTYEDGTPAKAGVVVFTSGTTAARGDVIDGSYSLGMKKDGEGIPLGTYAVIAEKFIPSIKTEENKNDTEEYKIKEPMTVEVKGPMTVDIVVVKLNSPK